MAVKQLCDGAGSIRSALDTVGSVWAMAVLAALQDGPVRYAEVKRRVVGINDRMLSQTLQRFVRDGLVERRVEGVRGEYLLTDLGEKVCAALGEFVYVILKHAPEVVAARARYEADG